MAARSCHKGGPYEGVGWLSVRKWKRAGRRSEGILGILFAEHHLGSGEWPGAIRMGCGRPGSVPQLSRKLPVGSQVSRFIYPNDEFSGAWSTIKAEIKSISHCCVTLKD